MTLAGFLIITLPILYAFLLDWKQKRQTLVVTIVLFLIAFVGLLLNETRGAWLALAITLPLITLLYDCSIKKSFFNRLCDRYFLGVFKFSAATEQG